MMRNPRKWSFALFVALWLVWGSWSLWAQAPPPASQNQSDSSATKKTDASSKDTSAAASTTNSPTNPAGTAKAQTPPPNSAGMVWVNTDSGVYHKPGSRWYGKTKKGKYMLEVDAKKAGYKEAK